VQLDGTTLGDRAQLHKRLHGAALGARRASAATPRPEVGRVAGRWNPEPFMIFSFLRRVTEGTVRSCVVAGSGQGRIFSQGTGNLYLGVCFSQDLRGPGFRGRKTPTDLGKKPTRTGRGAVGGWS